MISSAETLAEALHLAAQHGEGTRFLAGGTDLVVQMRRGRVAPPHLVDITRIEALQGVTLQGGVTTIGALTTHRALEAHPAFQGALRSIVEAAQQVGGHQVRNLATLGGNLANASPAADLLPPLLTLETEVMLAGVSGTRVEPLDGFVLAPGHTRRAPGEIITALRFIDLAPGSATAFLKAGRRKAMEISIASVAALVTRDASGRCARVRIALGAVAPVPLRVSAAEQFLQGRHADDAALQRAGDLAAEACRPIDDVRASAAYRRLLVRALVPRVLRLCLDRIEPRT
jgi:carbon-monoxide dehydrogenase medium subunit